jgi:protein-disulfide isomerase
VLPQLIDRYVSTGQLRITWNDFAWYGDESRVAAQAARCAAHEDMFWGYRDILYANQRGINQGRFSSANLKQWARDLGLSPEAFDACLDAGEDIPSIREDLARGRSLGITATPVFIINGQRVFGPQNVAIFTQIIESKLLEAGS